MNKIRKGDQVIVLTGRDKGKRGVVAARIDEDRVTVDGVNVVKKHVKPNPMKGTTGGGIEKTMPARRFASSSPAAKKSRFKGPTWLNNNPPAFRLYTGTPSPLA